MFTRIAAPAGMHECMIDGCGRDADWLVLRYHLWDGSTSCADHLDAVSVDWGVEPASMPWPLAKVFAYLDDAGAELAYIERYVNMAV